MNVLFLVCLAVIILCAIRGRRKGFLVVVFDLLSWVLIALFVSWANPQVQQYIVSNTKVYESVSSGIQENMEKRIEDKAQASNAESILPLSGQYQTTLEQSLQATSSQAAGIVAGQMALLIIKAISIMITFVIAVLVIRLIRALVAAIGKLPVIRVVNKAGGMVAGAFEGVIIIWLFDFIMMLLWGTDFGYKMITYIFENPFLIYLYQHNPFCLFL